MTTTITATPQPASASVLLEVTTVGPTVVLDQDGADIVWTSTYALDVTDVGDSCRLDDDGTAFPDRPYALRNLTGLTVGRIYRVEVSYARPAAAAVLEAGGPEHYVNLRVGSGDETAIIEFTATATTHSIAFYLAEAESLTVHHITAWLLPSGYVFSLTRSDANGLRSVRLLDGQDAASGSLTVTDYEPALTGPITYTVVVTPTETAAVTTALDLAETRLAVAVAPQHATTVALVTGYTEDNPSRSTVHEIIGAEYVAMTLRPLGRRQGTLDIWCADYAAARAVVGVYRRGEVVQLRQGEHPGLDMYHAATGRVVAEPHPEATQPRRWRVSVDYHESQVPTDPLSGSLGWDYAASLERHATYAESLAEFPTYADRYVGPVS